jgi:hypothetical protein
MNCDDFAASPRWSGLSTDLVAETRDTGIAIVAPPGNPVGALAPYGEAENFTVVPAFPFLTQLRPPDPPAATVGRLQEPAKADRLPHTVDSPVALVMEREFTAQRHR